MFGKGKGHAIPEIEKHGKPYKMQNRRHGDTHQYHTQNNNTTTSKQIQKANNVDTNNNSQTHSNKTHIQTKQKPIEKPKKGIKNSKSQSIGKSNWIGLTVHM